MTLGWVREVISSGDLFQRILQRWASTLTSRLNARHRSNTRPSIERSERSYILFRKTEGKDRALYRDRCQSRARESTTRKFLPKLKIMDKDKDLALSLPRSLSIVVDHHL